jgi:hypothetical protein
VLVKAKTSEEKEEWVKELVSCKQILLQKSQSYINLGKAVQID